MRDVGELRPGSVGQNARGRSIIPLRLGAGTAPGISHRSQGSLGRTGVGSDSPEGMGYMTLVHSCRGHRLPVVPGVRAHRPAQSRPSNAARSSAPAPRPGFGAEPASSATDFGDAVRLPPMASPPPSPWSAAGRIVTAGDPRPAPAFAVARHIADGTLDTASATTARCSPASGRHRCPSRHRRRHRRPQRDRRRPAACQRRTQRRARPRTLRLPTAPRHDVRRRRHRACPHRASLGRPRRRHQPRHRRRPTGIHVGFTAVNTGERPTWPSHARLRQRRVRTKAVGVADASAATDVSGGIAIDAAGNIVQAGTYVTAANVKKLLTARYTAAGDLDTSSYGDSGMHSSTDPMDVVRFGLRRRATAPSSSPAGHRRPELAPTHPRPRRRQRRRSRPRRLHATGLITTRPRWSVGVQRDGKTSSPRAPTTPGLPGYVLARFNVDADSEFDLDPAFATGGVYTSSLEFGSVAFGVGDRHARDGRRHPRRRGDGPRLPPRPPPQRDPARRDGRPDRRRERRRRGLHGPRRRLAPAQRGGRVGQQSQLGPARAAREARRRRRRVRVGSVHLGLRQRRRVRRRDRPHPQLRRRRPRRRRERHPIPDLPEGHRRRRPQPLRHQRARDGDRPQHRPHGHHRRRHGRRREPAGDAHRQRLRPRRHARLPVRVGPVGRRGDQPRAPATATPSRSPRPTTAATTSR